VLLDERVDVTDSGGDTWKAGVMHFKQQLRMAAANDNSSLQ